MIEWKKLTDENELEEIIKKLRHIYINRPETNYFFSYDMNKRDLRGRNMVWSQQGQNVFLLEDMQTYSRLYYFLWDDESIVEYPDFTKDKIVCDLFDDDRKPTNKYSYSFAEKNGFIQYKKYYMWINKLADADYNCQSDIVIYENDRKEEIILDIKECFDYLSDGIPSRDNWARFWDNKRNIYGSMKGQDVGGVVYACNGKTITEEYIYVLKNYRGMNYSQDLQLSFLKICKEMEAKKVIAWIEVRNEPSLLLHKKNGFDVTGNYKETYIKRV